MSAFHAFEYLAYIIPGAVLLCGVFWLSPELKAPWIEDKIDLGGFGIFVILALVAGLLTFSVARYVPEKWIMRPLGLVHRTDAEICSQDKLQNKEIRTSIGEKLGVDMEHVCNSSDATARQDKRKVLRQIFAAEHAAGSHNDRVELFEQRYYMMLNLAAVFLILMPISIVLRPRRSLLIMPFLLVASFLSMLLTSYFDRLYATDLIQSFLGA